MHLVDMTTLLILLSLGLGNHHPRGQDITAALLSSFMPSPNPSPSSSAQRGGLLHRRDGLPTDTEHRADGSTVGFQLLRVSAAPRPELLADGSSAGLQRLRCLCCSVSPAALLPNDCLSVLCAPCFGCRGKRLHCPTAASRCYIPHAPHAPRSRGPALSMPPAGPRPCSPSRGPTSFRLDGPV
jgi:hypothetical protein